MSNSRIKTLLFSTAIAGKSKTHTIAYVAVMSALVVVANMFFEFKLAETQFSLTIVFSSLAGIILGPLFGFVASFMGDLVGFLYHSSGYPYMPWIGITMGLTAFIAGILINNYNTDKKGAIYIRIALSCLLTFVLGTVAINTTAFWLTYAPSVPYFKYLVSRLFIQGQIWNTLVNSALLFVIIPIFKKVKFIK